MSTPTLTPQTTTTAGAQPQRRDPTFVRWASNFGRVFTRPVDVIDAMVQSGLDFTVGKIELVARTPLGEELEVPGKVATVRYNADGTKAVLGTVGTGYQVCSNLDAFAWSQDLLDDHGANIVAASCYGKPLGSKAFVAARTERTFKIGGEVHDVYVLLHNSHDGSSGLNVSTTAVRRSTGTEINIAPNAAAQHWTVRHSGNLEAKAREAADTMRRVNTWVASFENMSHTLLAKPMPADTFTTFSERFLPTPKAAKDRSANLWAARRQELRDLFEVSPQCAFGRGTYLAAFNAACVWVDERYEARGENSQMVRAARGIDGRSTSTKQRAWDVLLHL